MRELDSLEYKKYAVVTYIVEENRVLLIKKKRGLGAGKINVPGGHIEEGESPYNAAVRETKEEVDLDVDNLTLMGYLFFKFQDGLTMKGWVYFTNNYSGKAIESEEADPFWCNMSQIPYEKMWEDDIVWIPEVLKGRFFRGYFEFDGDTMLNRRVTFYETLKEFNP